VFVFRKLQKLISDVAKENVLEDLEGYKIYTKKQRARAQIRRDDLKKSSKKGEGAKRPEPKKLTNMSFNAAGKKVIVVTKLHKILIITHTLT